MNAKLCYRLQIFFVITLCVLLVACVTGPPEGRLDLRLAGPCDRISLSWAVNAENLQVRLGTILRASEHDEVGELQLHIIQCNSPVERVQPLRYAYIATPIAATSAPLIVTTVPKDNWLAMTTLFTDNAAEKVFIEMGYEVEAAEIDLAVRDEEGTRVATARLATSSGTLQLDAKINGTSMPAVTHRALVTESGAATAIFFGEESGMEVGLTSISLDDTGVLAPWAIDDARPSARLVQGLMSDRILWRQPNAQ